MKLDLSEIVNNPGMHASVDVDQKCPEDPDLRCKAPVKGRIDLTNTGTLLLLGGEIKTEVILVCSRCLVDYSLPVASKLEEEFQIEQVGDSVVATPLEEDEFSAEIIHNNVLDVDELIRQNLLVAMPLAPLCKEECKGLCPTCGENLNVRQCSCPPSEEESPFKALADLLEDEDEKEK